MRKELFPLSEKIKRLREKSGRTQAGLAKELGVSRAAVNSWEMGVAAPSTALIIELCSTFLVSSDYLLGIEQNMTVDVSKLTPDEVALIAEVVKTISRNQ